MYTINTQATEFKSNKSKTIALFTALSVFSIILAPKVYGQGYTTVWNPLTPNASSQLPLVPSRTGAIPPIGSGATPLPPPIGMTGLPLTLPPSIPAIPATQIGNSFSGIGLPTSLPGALPPSSLPGGWAYSLFPFIPQQSSTPGPARPSLQSNTTSPNPAIPTTVMPAGGLPGTGGYYTTIPQIRQLGRNQSTQYEYRGRTAILGGGGNSQDEITQFGPLAGFGQVNGIPTGVGYNNGPAGTNNDLFNKSIDLGGGMRTRLGGAVVSTGKSVQDLNGYSALYAPTGGAVPIGGSNIGVGGLASSYVTTDYGQGARVAFPSAGQGINRTTDFGFPLMPATSALNGHPNELGRLSPPSAVETNF